MGETQACSACACPHGIRQGLATAGLPTTHAQKALRGGGGQFSPQQAPPWRLKLHTTHGRLPLHAQCACRLGHTALHRMAWASGGCAATPLLVLTRCRRRLRPAARLPPFRFGAPLPANEEKRMATVRVLRAMDMTSCPELDLILKVRTAVQHSTNTNAVVGRSGCQWACADGRAPPLSIISNPHSHVRGPACAHAWPAARGRPSNALCRWAPAVCNNNNRRCARSGARPRPASRCWTRTMSTSAPRTASSPRTPPGASPCARGCCSPPPPPPWPFQTWGR